MAEVDELIARVVEESGKSESELKEKIKSRKEKTHGLLSDYGAIYAVAKEFGVDLNQKETVLIKLSDVSGQKSINIVGRVKVVFSPREFSRKDGSKGFFASIVLVDDSGELRLVLWDKNTEMTKHVQVGDVLLSKNVYSKENQGVFEVHAGSLSNIVVNPKMPDLKLPEVKEKLLKVEELSEGNPAVNILLRASSLLPRTEFTRSDGSVGSRASFVGEDKSGKIRVVLWDKASDLDLDEGDVVKIENGYTRKGLGEELELQAGNRARVVKSDVVLDLPKLPKKEVGKDVKISGLRKDDSQVNVEARILRVYSPRPYSNGTMASLILGDESATIRLVLWDERSEAANDLSRNDAVLISNAYVRSNMNDEVELHAGKYGVVKKLVECKIPQAEEIELKYTPTKSVAELEPGDSRVRISVKVVDVDAERPLFYMTCPSCNGKVQNLGGAWFCDSCGDIDPNANIVVSAVLEDKSGTIRGVFFRENAEKILGMDAEAAMNLIGESQNEQAPLLEARKKLGGSAVDMLGRSKYNDYADQLEFIVEEFS